MISDNNEIESPQDDASEAGTPNAEEMELLAELALRELEAQRQRTQSQLEELAREVEKKFDKRKALRSFKDEQMLESTRMYIGSAAKVMRSGTARNRSPDRPFRSDSYGRDPEHNIVKTKSDIAISQSINMQFGGGDKNWDILPSSDPKDEFGNPVDPKIAERSAVAMENVISAQLECAKYGYQSRMGQEDRVILGTAVVKGPKNVLNQKKKYRSQMSSTGQAVPIAMMQPVAYPSIIRVNPWFFYPDETVNDICDAEDTIEVHLVNKMKMATLATNEDSGFFDFKDAIIELLKEGSPKEFSFSESFTQFVQLTEGQSVFKGKYCVLEYHGPVTKELLLGVGKEPTYESPDDLYLAEVWVCQGRVIRIELETLDGEYEVPYAVCVWEKDPSSIHGIGLPMFLSDQQKVVNITYKMMLDNASISSGPQVIINREVIEPALTDQWFLTPDKIWFSTELGDGDVNKAIQFFTPPNVTTQLQAIMQMAKAFAEEESGIPLLAAGLGSPGIAESATEATLQQQSSTIMSDYKNEAWDDCITSKVIRWMHDWNWENNQRQDIRGDFEIDVKSSSEYRNKIMHIKNLEKLSIEGSQNEGLGMILDMPEIQRARISMMTLPATNLVKSDEQIQQEAQQRAQEAAQHPDPEILKLQIMQGELQVKQQAQQLEAQRIQMEYGIKQQEAQWQHQEKMLMAYAKMREAEASVLAAQDSRQIEFLKLAQKDTQHRDKILADIAQENSKQSSDKFLAGIEQTNKIRDNIIQQEQLKIDNKVADAKVKQANRPPVSRAK